MKKLRSLFLSGLFFYGCAGLVVLMVLSYPFPLLQPLAFTAIALFLLITAIDGWQVFNRGVRLEAARTLSPVLSLGDENPVQIALHNRSSHPLWLEVIDELPEQLQQRDFVRHAHLPAGRQEVLPYTVRPVARGEYHFGALHVWVATRVGLVKRQISFPLHRSVPVYPSLIQMKKYELKTLARIATEYGVKKVRRIGHSYEFEQIKHYVQGDDYRSINWKATGRKAQLMVNQYEDEKSQQVYCIIDKSRVMHMPFNGLSLFDYAVNASLVVSNIVLGKQDKIGLVTFADTPKTLIRADRSRQQLKKILEGLYREKEGNTEASYEGLYLAVRKLINGRSLLFFYTNFESTYALQRALPQLRKLNTQHLLVVVFFENTEIKIQSSQNVKTLEDVYEHVTAEDFSLTKVQLAQQLRQLGIITILTQPENLTIASINKYLELKSRGMI
ncbi:MAG: DUF58 domain-containing protein [Bacteroidota bacterium]